MADQLVKNNNQSTSGATQKNTGQEKESSASSGLNTKASNSISTANQSNDIIKQQRTEKDVQASKTLAINALYNVATEQTTRQVKKSINAAPTSLRSKNSARSDKSAASQRSTQRQSSSSAEEIREMNAIRTANKNQTATAASNRTVSNRAGVSARSPEDGPEEAALQQKLVGQDNSKESLATTARYASDAATQPNREPSTAQALDKVGLNTSAESIKLLDIVGPEAVLSFREKLQQVWVTLDENAAKQLDVIARMPATLTGATAMELLMVESPQGIHFVAFLKNKNDFEVLATFDRRALLPESPSRQLVEAGIIAYEQLDSVFKEGGQRIEQRVKEMAASKETNNVVFNELQRLMVQEKRRRRKFKQTIDYFLDKLDEMDLEADYNDAPFVPREISNQDTSIQTGQSGSEIDVEKDIANDLEQEGYGLRSEDGDFR